MIQTLKYRILFFICLATTSVFAQNKQIDKANKRYELKKYAEAIPFYEQGLKIDNSLNAKTRLAFCHRMTNNVGKAEEMYQEIVNHKRAKPVTWLYYGETLMMQGKYDEAKKWFEKYTKKKSGDKKGWDMLARLENMQSIVPYFKDTKVEAFAYNTDADDSAPLKYNNGIVFSSDRKQGLKLLKQRSGWTGRDFINIYHSELKEDGTYESPKALPKKINATNKNCGNPTFSPDGKTMVFSRNSDWATKRGDYNIMLFSAQATSKGKWKDVEMLSFCNLNANYMHPAFSVTGDTLFYVSDRPGGLGGTDIFYSYKKGSKWTRPKNLSDKINTTSNEGYPFVDAKGRLFFCSKGHVGYGGFDIFYAQQDEEGEWQTPVNVGFPINSSYDEVSIFVEKDEQSGMFASARDGEDDDIYFFTTNNSHPDEIENPFVRGIKEEQATIVEETVTASIEPIVDSIEPIVEKPILTEDVTIETQEIEKVTEEEVLDEIIAESMSQKTEDEAIEEMKEELIDLVPVDEVDENKEIEIVQKEKDKPKVILEKTETESIDRPIVQSLDDFEIEIPTMNNRVDHSLYGFLSGNSSSKNPSYVFRNIKFSPEQFKLTDEMKNDLTPLVEILKAQKDVKLEIGAHTESLGDDKRNMVLSIKRATSIAGFLIRNGIDSARLKVMGYGETQLMNRCSNDIICTQEEHFVNHRIVLKVID